MKAEKEKEKQIRGLKKMIEDGEENMTTGEQAAI